MKTNVYFLSLLACGVLTSGALFTSCSSDIDEIVTNDIEKVDEGLKTAKMSFNVRKTSFDANTYSRSIDEGWTDEDIVFIEFDRANGETTNGHAVYNGKTEEWNVSFNLQLPKDTMMACRVFYFEGIKGTDTVLAATELQSSYKCGVYVDSAAYYVYSNNVLTVNAVLSPKTSRIRFKGDAESTVLKSYSVYGIKYISGFDKSTNTILYETYPVDFSIEGNGYSDYIYGVFTDVVKPSLYVNYDEYSFFAECGDNMLVIGKSGWMNIPTTKKHNGWNQTIVEGETNGYRWVDLGLPSGIKWATNNIGADNEYNVGNKFCWGAITTDGDYFDSNTDISGIQYRDAARAIWKTPWRMPTKAEWEELKDNTQTIVNASSLLSRCCKFVGSNGKILNVFSTEFSYSDYYYCYYWTSTPANADKAYSMVVRSNSIHSVTSNEKRSEHFPIRPVFNL